MNYGFTTGSCSAAAAKASTYMLFSGEIIGEIRIDTPAGIPYCPKIEDVTSEEGTVKSGVRKFSGDDPDITKGTMIYARAELIRDGKEQVLIEGGEGVGIVTRPGLDQPVGNAAINSVPRRMIDKEVREIMEMFDVKDSVRITVSVPEGLKLAKKTFNPRLGIEGGISIIGTSGLVEPMSTGAILDTIRVELRQRKEEGATRIVISPGNYGLDFMKEHYGYDLNRAVKCSNYIGDTIDMAAELGFAELLLAGHVGKLIKISGGIMNTHSKEADCRMELMAAAAARVGVENEVLVRILDCVNTEEAYGILKETGKEEACFKILTERIRYYLQKRAGDRMQVACMVYSNRWGLLGKTDGAEKLLQ